MPLLFSYGTLRDEVVQLSTFGRRLDGQPDELVGFSLSSVRIDDPLIAAAEGRSHHTNVTFNGRPDSRVNGIALEVTDTELALADRYEERANYIRTAASLASGRQAWVYVDGPSAPTPR